MDRRLRVLVSAYACSPYQGSEPGVGWGFVSALSKYHELWVIVEEENFREPIERWRAEHPNALQNVHFHYIRKRRNPLLRKIWPPSYYWYYRDWQKEAYAFARALHREVGFDLVHQLTMVGFREPGYLWKLGVPFVWGPIGGMGFFPWRLLTTVGGYGALYYLAYNMFNWLQMRWYPRPRRAAQAAESGLIAATSENQSRALRYWGCRSTLVSEVGLPGNPAVAPERRDTSQPFRVVWSGQHTAGKALNLGVEALARLPGNLDWQLDVLGVGRMTDRWKKLASRLGIAERCRFHGWIPRDRALQRMRDAHVALVTSLRDLTSTVTIEALANGLPVVCLDHCGFSSAVDDTCGIKVPVTHPEAVIEGLANAIAALGNDEDFRVSLARGAIGRSRLFSWEAKVESVNRIYQTRVAG